MLGVESPLLIASKSTFLRLGVLKKQYNFSIIPRQFRIGCKLHAVDTAKFKECATQCTYSALGYFACIIDFTPLNCPDIFAAPSYPWPYKKSQLIPLTFRAEKKMI